MRLLKITKMTLIMLSLGGLTIAASSCTAASTTAPKTQTVAVQRGNLTVDITGVGNLALSQKDDLAFEIPGTVAEILVKAGDTVTKGQVLARLDTTDWDTQVSALEDKVTAAERQLTTKQRALTTAERQLATKKDAVTTAERQLATKKDAVTTARRQLATKKDAVITAERQMATKKDAVITAERQLAVKKRNVTAKERDVLQAEINLKDAQTVLDTTQVTYTVADFTKAQANVDAAKTELETALQKISRYAPGTDAYWIYQDLLSSAQSKLKSAQAKLDDMLSGFKEELAKNQRLVDTAQWNLESARIAVDDAQIAVDDAQKAIETAQIAVDDAQKGIENAQIAVEDAQLGIVDAQLAVKDAEKALADARKALADAQKEHPEITAPSDGFITKVNVIGGAIVQKGTVAVTLADPNKFEADILVNETDILKTKLGGDASVQVEAIPGLSLSGNVTAIAPTATISSGVVNFKVTVAVGSLQSAMQALQPVSSNLSSGNVTSPRQPRGGNPFSGNVTSGALPAVEGGRLTRLTPEQIEEMRRQRQQGQETPPALPAVTSSDFQLREGQTVTVSILVAASNNVLLVPNSAITSQGGQRIVKVLNNGVIEQRPITVGISNYQYTEVSAGLSEGEQVVVPQNTAPTTPTTSQQGGQGAIRIPGAGMGGFAR